MFAGSRRSGFSSPSATGEVDPGLRLVLGRVLLRVRVEDAALGLAVGGKRHLVRGVRAVQHPGDDAVLALVDRARRGLAAHRAVDRLDGHLAGERRGVRLPRRDLALARLARRGGGVQRLADGLVDRLDVEAEERSDAGGGRGAEVGDVVDLVLVQADRPHEVDLDLVAGREARARARCPSAPTCWATARIGGMLSPGCEYSAARKVSW